LSQIITPEDLAKNNTEDGHQLALMQWCALNFDKYPELKWLHHSPNGGSRHKAEASKLKAMGVKEGFPDLLLLVKRGQWSGLTIELKRIEGGLTAKGNVKKKGVVRKEQEDWGKFLQSQGFGFSVCYGWEMARDILIQYLRYKE
jgi:hypothetical protein